MNESGGSVTWDLDVNDSGLKSGLNKAKNDVSATGEEINQSLGKKLSSIGTSLYRTGAELSRTVTLPVVALGTAVFKTSADFEESLNKIVGLVGISRIQVNAWTKDFEALGAQTGKAPNDLAQAMFFITSAGLRGQRALDALTASAKASAAGLGDTATVADAVTSAVNSYAKSNLSASRATDILAAAVKAGKVDASTIAPVLGNILPIAASLKVRFEDVAGAMASMTRVGLDAATAGTSIRGVLSALIKPGQQAKDALSSVGLNFQNLRDILAQPGGIIQVMRLLNEKFGDNEEAMAAVIPDVRAFRGVMAVLAQDSGSVSNVMDQVANSVGLTNTAFEAASEGPGFKFHQVMSQISSALINLGDVAAPIMSGAMQTLGRTISSITRIFDNLPRGVQKTIIEMLGLAAALGPVLLLTGSLIRLTGNFGEALGAIEKHPIIYALVTLATVLIYLQARFDIFGKAADGVTRAFNALSGVLNRDVEPVIKDVSKFFQGIFRDAVNIGKRAVNDFTGAIQDSINWVKQHQKGIEQIVGVLTVIFGPALIKLGVQSAITAAQMAADAVVAGAGWIAQAVVSGATWTAQFAVMTTNAVANATVQTAQAVISGTKWVASAVASGGAWIGNFVLMSAGATALSIKFAAQAAISGYVWIFQAGRASAAWLIAFPQMVLSATITAAQFVVQAAIAGGAWIVNFIAMSLRAIATASIMVIQAIISGSVWLYQAIIAGGAWLVQLGLMAAGALATAATMAIAATQVGIAWLVALGPIGLIIAAIVAIAAGAYLIITHWNEVKAFFGRIGGDVLGAIGNFGNLLYDSGRTLIDGFIKGIKDKFGDVKDTLVNLTRKLTSWKGPADLDKKILAGSGKLVIQGFVDGLESQYGIVKSSLGGLTNSLGINPGLSAPSFSTAQSSPSAVSQPSIIQNNNIYNQVDLDQVTRDLSWRLQVR